MRLVFWTSVAFVAYTYAGYPLCVYLRSRWGRRPIRAQEIFLPVSIVMSVHNEEKSLPRKLRNLGELDYPSDLYEIIVVSDGSTDATNQILTSSASRRLRVFILPNQEGKASALNKGIQEARGRIVVLTDSRQRIEAKALRHLLANFADPSVGCVSGELMLGDPNSTAGAQGLGFYWKLEKLIREWESASGSVVGATGALYAARRELLTTLPKGTLLDDVYLPMHVVRGGKRVIFDPQARTWDRLATPRCEYRRKVRTLTGNYQLLHHAPWLLTFANPLLFRFVSHKLMRLLAPFALLAVLVSSMFLQGILYQSVFLLQVVFYSLPALLLLKGQLRLAGKLGEASLAFLLLNTAATVAFFYFLTGKKHVWVR